MKGVRPVAMVEPDPKGRRCPKCGSPIEVHTWWETHDWRGASAQEEFTELVCPKCGEWDEDELEEAIRKAGGSR